MKLFLVESPYKIKTLQKLLNSQKNEFILRATFGHIKDLPLKSLGVDLNTFKPNFYFLSSKKKVLNELRKLLPSIDEVYLATDPDREGEAIAYHLYEYLKNKNKKLKFKRIDLIEITEEGLKRALLSPREVNKNLYESWLTRRVLDRLIGYLISPKLSQCFKIPLSAGRVQSVALRLIVEREKEIKNFIPITSYSLEVFLQKDGLKIKTELFYKNQLLKLLSKEEFIKIFQEKILNKNWILQEIKEKIEKKQPPFPLKTSTLIENAQKYLGFEPKETMKYAQSLYENGYITYMRTDSIRVSKEAKRKAKEFIKYNFGENYIGKGRRAPKSKFVQDAHEAIRPTNIFRQTVPLSLHEKKLYQLIYTIFIASQMAPAKFLVRTYIFINKNFGKEYSLRVTSKKLIFDGFLRLLGFEKETFLDLELNEIFKAVDYKIKPHTTKPPERYTSSSLIKKLESLGIGRPSTYATLLDILYKRKYVVKEKKYLKPTELGERVCEFLINNFSKFLDYRYTAELEEDLEKVMTQEKTYLEIVNSTYELLKNYLNNEFSSI